MSLLREYIRTLLTEAAKGPDDLIAFPEIMIVVWRSGHGDVSFSYESQAEYIEPRVPARDGPEGSISIAKAKDEDWGPCGDAYMVTGANADHGWGPLLYDVAMEYATLNGGGLIADRGSISADARKVWSYYLHNRSDVIDDQLDDLKNTLTPSVEEDNCEQNVSTYSTGYPSANTVDWTKSPVSKRYTVSPVVIPALKRAGRWIEE